MSLKLMAAAWELDIPSTEKMVLLCLCDFANDEGICWPSVPTIARKCSKGARTVQGAIQWLRKNDFCSWDETPGRPHQFRLNPRKICTPAEIAPPQKTTQTPAESAPEPLRTTSSIKKRAHALPENWEPVLTAAAQRIVDGWPPGMLETQLAKFRDHAADKGRTSKDWQAAFRTWITNAQAWKPANDRHQKPSGTATAAERARANLGCH